MTTYEDNVRALEAELASVPDNETHRRGQLLAQLGSNLEAIGQRETLRRRRGAGAAEPGAR